MVAGGESINIKKSMQKRVNYRVYILSHHIYYESQAFFQKRKEAEIIFIEDLNYGMLSIPLSMLSLQFAAILGATADEFDNFGDGACKHGLRSNTMIGCTLASFLTDSLTINTLISHSIL